MLISCYNFNIFFKLFFHFHIVQLWCSSNYHWYLKQEIPSVKATPTDNEMQFAGMVWDPILPLRLHTILTSEDLSLSLSLNTCICLSLFLPIQMDSIYSIIGEGVWSLVPHYIIQMIPQWQSLTEVKY